MNKNSFLIGAGTGALAAYLLDPRSGTRRRVIATDKLFKQLSKLECALRAIGHDLQGQYRGAVAEASSFFKSEEVSDEILEQRVRSKLGRVVTHPRAVRVQVENGSVTLSGPVLAQERGDLLSAIRHVRGVKNVEDQLEAHEDSGSIPSLQGTGKVPRSIPASSARILQLLGGVAGITLLTRGLTRGGTPGLAATLAGAGLLTKVLTDSRLRGVGIASDRGIEVQKSLTIEAPVEEVFKFWSEFENFPRFMSHIREITTSGDRSTWVVDGPGGIPVRWNAVTLRTEPNSLIAWASEPNSIVENHGTVRFEKLSDTRTKIHVQLSYHPPGGAVGHSLAFLLGANPKSFMDEDLLRLKSLIEVGKTRKNGKEVTADILRGQPSL